MWGLGRGASFPLGSVFAGPAAGGPVGVTISAGDDAAALFAAPGMGDVRGVSASGAVGRVWFIGCSIVVSPWWLFVYGFT